MIILFLLGYLLPAILIFLHTLLFDKGIRTVRELLECWYYYLIPFFNIFCLLILICMLTIDFLKDRIELTKFKKVLQTILDKKLNKL